MQVIPSSTQLFSDSEKCVPQASGLDPESLTSLTTSQRNGLTGVAVQAVPQEGGSINQARGRCSRPDGSRPRSLLCRRKGTGWPFRRP
eukprot:5028420-Amphidinium_carterae.1